MRNSGGPFWNWQNHLVARIAEELGNPGIMLLSARSADDTALIAELPEMRDIGTIIVDDFHRIDDKTKEKISDFMKLLVDFGDPKSKFIFFRINKSGDNLIRFMHDLGMRNDMLKIESNSDEK